MDKPDLAMNRKGVVLTMDALFALALLLISAIIIIMMLARPSAQQPPGSQAAGDMMDSLKSMKLAELDGNPRYPYANYVLHNNLTSAFNRTVIEAIADLYMSNKTGEAQNLSSEMLEPAIPGDYGVDLMIENSSTFNSMFSSSRGAQRNYVSVARHFIYYNNVTREIRLVLYK